MSKSLILISLIVTIFLGAGLGLYIMNLDHEEEVLGTVNAGPNEDNPKQRLAWRHERLRDPATGEIPPGMRSMEMKFARTLPNDAGSKNLNWLARGPHNIGGRTRALAYDVENPNRLIAGGVTGAIYISENNGEHWIRVTTPDHFPAVSCIVQDTRPGKTNIWYYGSGEARGGYIVSQFYYGDGLYKSTDHGYTWAALEATQGNEPHSFDSEWNFVNRLAIDASNTSEDIVYAAIYGGIRRSSDGGNSWTEVLGAGSPSSYYTELAITTTGVVYASLDSDGADKGLWRSVDGLTWINITPLDTFPPEYERVVVAVSPSNENDVYFLGKTPGYGKFSQAFFGYEDWNSLWKYSYISGDGTGAGGSWENLSEFIPGDSPAVFDNFYSQHSYNMMMTISPHDPELILIGATNLYRSTDGFTSSQNCTQIGGYWVGSTLPAGNWGSYENHHPDLHLAVFHPTDTNMVYSATDGGLYLTNAIYDSIVSWVNINKGYNTTQVYTVGFDRTSTDDVLVAGFQDNANYFVNSSDTTVDWVMPLNGDGSYMGIAPDKEFYILSINRGIVYKMNLNDDGGVLGFNRIDPASVNPDNYLFINPLIMDPNNQEIIYIGAGNQLYRNNQLSSIPYSNQHDSINTGWFGYSSVAGSTVKISCIDVSVDPAHTVWYGTSNRRIFKVENAHIGDPEHIAMPIIQFPSAYVSRIAIHPQHADTVIVVFSNYKVYSLFYTIDGGASWIKGAGNLEEHPGGTGAGPSLGTVAILPRHDGDLYLVGTTVGLFASHSLDSTNTVWTQIGTDVFGKIIVEDIKVRELDGLVVIGTYGQGVYSTHINSVADVFPSIGIQESMVEEIDFKIYPNPAREIINLELSHFALGTKLQIVDLTGQVVLQQELVNATTGININKLAPGTYICQIEIDNQRATKRFVKQ